MEKKNRRRLALAVGVAIALAIALSGIPYVSVAVQVLLAGVAVLVLLWLLSKAYRAFLYKVGRRLAFSYFLLGVLPIPMVLVLLGLGAYILAGFFLGHLYRDAVAEIRSELRAAASAEAGLLARTHGAPPGTAAHHAFGYYRDGRRIAGDRRTPAAWPSWAAQEQSAPATREQGTHFFATGDGSQTLAAAAQEGRYGVIAFFGDNLDRELSRRADLWVETDRPDDPDLIQLELLRFRLPLRQIRREQKLGEAEKFFKRISGGERFWDNPLLWWAEVSGPLLDPSSGRILSERLSITLNSTPRTVLRHLFSTSGEIDSKVWGTLLLLAALLFDVYLVAALMAGFLIVGLSRAVNRMSQATAAVREGEFSVRIPVRRRDQIGDLQRSFNEMAAHLETLVATAAQKEVLEKELDIARDLQKSLLPTDLPAGQEIELATLFEPSAAIGGDYFDVLRLSDGELAVIIADVSGHGLPAGLRMAMIKAALLILVEETRDPEEILRRLDGIVRRESRVFVTATLGLLNLQTGLLRLTNAGHPPTYLLRGGGVEELVLPSSPLGGLGKIYGHAAVPLLADDVVVWLSDGLIEAVDGRGEPFGYDAIVTTLATVNGAAPRASHVRDRLLGAVERYVGTQPPSDDRTLVVMRYLGPKTLTP